MNEITVEFLDSLTTCQLMIRFLNARDSFVKSEGFANYGGKSRELIIKEYNLIFEYIENKLARVILI